MNEKLKPAVEALITVLNEQQAAVANTKKTINQVCQMMGEPAMFTDVEYDTSFSGTLRSDQYYGKGLTPAAEEYLKRRNQACSADEIMKGLEQGGFDFDATGWKEKDRLRMLAITLAKNSYKFHKLPNNTFGLLEWYPAVVNKRPDKAEKADKHAEEASVDSPSV